MKLSYNWLKDYLEMDLTPAQVAEAMTSIGIEVDSLEEQEEIPGGLAGVVVAKVVECIPHPDSDHLHLTKVDAGTGELLQVVCGAPNVAAGQKVLFAQIGTVLPGDFKIKKSKIRGTESMGMICAEDELGIGTSHEGIMVLPDDAVIGTPAKDYLHLKTEAVIEYELTANRVDAASHIGVARDLYAWCVFNKVPCKMKYPDVSAFREAEGEGLSIDVPDPDGAPRYSGVTIEGVKVAPSPEWLQKKLLSIGLRPINNVVDISNFILFEMGQPLHTFDADKVAGGKVIVRRAAQGEHIRTLDGVDHTLCDRDMVIANAEGPMCIAGVFGGEDSGVTEATTRVFLESAYFDPASIRRTSKTQGLQTDASFRFERGADFAVTRYALQRAALLICELTGGHMVGKVQESYPEKLERRIIDIDYRRISDFIGKEISAGDIKTILDALNYEFLEESADGARVEAPSYMIDVYRECDVVEEILRIYGYNNVDLPQHMKMSVTASPTPQPEAIRNQISNFLAANGFTETMNNSLTKGAYYDGLLAWPSENCVHVVNPLSSDLNVMRQTLILGGLEVVAYNLNRQIARIKTFEYGSVYRRLPEKDAATLDGYEEHQNFALLMTGAPEKNWTGAAPKTDFYQLKGYVEMLLRRYGSDIWQLWTGEAPADIYSEGITYSLPGGKKTLAVMGTVNPALTRKFGIKQGVVAAEINWNNLFELVKRGKVTFSELPKFPEVRRDLALLLDEGVKYGDLRAAAFKNAKHLLKGVSLFDVYRGDKIPSGKKQYALSFVLQDSGRTLTDQDVENVMERLLSAFKKDFGAELR
ncbi:MAG: phenylalanine--tRNA ligase subunit beta [Bacteroidales bacterium]|nr:phenylalanine--tRNA ligase subunit beta [Bacteroidales bacterium]